MHGVAASRVEVVHGRTVGDEASEHGEMLALGDLSPLKQQFLEHILCNPSRAGSRPEPVDRSPCEALLPVGGLPCGQYAVCGSAVNIPVWVDLRQCKGPH
jgi:hypothetical protein